MAHAEVDELATYSSVPVLNALTDSAHPCQALADVMTIRERFGRLEGVRLAYLGDGNNVCSSLMVAAAKLGMAFAGGLPRGLRAKVELALADANEAAAQTGGDDRDQETAPSRPPAAPTSSTRTSGRAWARRPSASSAWPSFQAYRIDERILDLAGPEAVVMHCLPAHYGEEISEQIAHGPRSAIWDQAENRLHAQKALMALVMH